MPDTTVTAAKPSTVSRILGREHTRSRTVRGRRANNDTEGFRVRSWLGETRVTWQQDTHGFYLEANDARRTEALAAYATTLKAFGYAVQVSEDHLTVIQAAS